MGDAYRSLGVVPECDGEEEPVHWCKDCKWRKGRVSEFYRCASVVKCSGEPRGKMLSGASPPYCSTVRLFDRGTSCEGFEERIPWSERFFGWIARNW